MDIKTLPIDFWITLGTVIFTLILGQVVKKIPSLDKKKIIPIQNLCVGLFVFGTQYLITRDINISVALSGILSGGVYDIGKAIKQIFIKED